MGVIAGASESAINEFDMGKSTKWLEDKITFYGQDLVNPKSFSFPEKTPASAILNICRAITRKMERRAVSFFRENQKI